MKRGHNAKVEVCDISRSIESDIDELVDSNAELDSYFGEVKSDSPNWSLDVD